MALVPCPECSAQVSSDAPACPHCGKPNPRVANKARDSQQHAGCALMLAGMVVCLFSWPVGGLILIVGLIYAAIHTRVM